MEVGQDVEAHPIDTKKHIDYLPEHNPIHLEMYVQEYLDYVAQLYRLPDRKAKVEEVIERVGLTPEDTSHWSAFKRLPPAGRVGSSTDPRSGGVDFGRTNVWFGPHPVG